MSVDPVFARLAYAREHRVALSDAVVRAFSGRDVAERAAMCAAEGQLELAARFAPAPFKTLAEGTPQAVLAEVDARARERGVATAPDRFAGAEALLVAGGIRAGVEALAELHGEGFAPATLSLARRLHQLGDHGGAMRVAAALPEHALGAIARAQAALKCERPAQALAALEPFLGGARVLPEVHAGAAAVLAAQALAALGHVRALERFADAMLAAPDLSPTLLAPASRVGWLRGRGAEVWTRLEQLPADDPWANAARVELSLLAGDAERASHFLARPASCAPHVTDSVAHLTGTFAGHEALARQLADPERSIHLWRTAGARYAGWVDAASEAGARVSVFDLGAGVLPAPDDVPDLTLDDAVLVGLLPPRPVALAAPAALPVHVHRWPCRGVGAGLDVEGPALARALSVAVCERAADAGVWVAPGDAALALAARGRPVVAFAVPGDPYWLGPLPERAFSGLAVVRPHPVHGWRDAPREVEAALARLLDAR